MAQKAAEKAANVKAKPPKGKATKFLKKKGKIIKNAIKKIGKKGAKAKLAIKGTKKLFENTRTLSKKHFTHLGITIDTDKRQVLYDDNEILFRPKEFELLYKLLSNPGKVFTREQLVQDIWGFEYFGDTRTVDVHIRWIREKIEENSQKPTKIITLRGVGYKSNVE